MKLVFTVALLFSSFASAAVNQDLFRTWHMASPVYQDSRGTILMDITFQTDSATVTANCQYADGARLSVSAKGLTTYTEDSITTLEEKTNDIRDSGGHTCTAQLNMGTVNYEIQSNGDLLIKFQGQSQLFKR